MGKLLAKLKISGTQPENNDNLLSSDKAANQKELKQTPYLIRATLICNIWLQKAFLIFLCPAINILSHYNSTNARSLLKICYDLCEVFAITL